MRDLILVLVDSLLRVGIGLGDRTGYGWTAVFFDTCRRFFTKTLTSPRTRTWHQPDEYSAGKSPAADKDAFQPFSKPVLLIGDNQIQNLFGDPDSTSSLMDQWSEPSVRPPITSMFSDLVLQDVLGRRDASLNTLPVIHMGDALNTSCATELQRFEAVLDRAIADGHIGPHRGFVMLPGNHDGFLYGNMQSRQWRPFWGAGGLMKVLRMALNAQTPEWECRCADPFSGRPMAKAIVDKNCFLNAYLAILHRIYPAKLSERSILVDNITMRLIYPANDKIDLFRGAVLHLDEKHPHRSFLVQLVALTGDASAEAEIVAGPDTEPDAFDDDSLWSLLLDSCNYGTRPSRAGMYGEISKLQVTAAKKLVDELAQPNRMHNQNGSPLSHRVAAHSTRIAFMLHHNISALSAASRKRLTQLFVALEDKDDVQPVSAAVSAHRHRGGWYSTKVTDSNIWWWNARSVRWTELNTSSLIDWPLGFRDLRFYVASNPTRAVLYRMESQQYRVTERYDPTGKVTDVGDLLGSQLAQHADEIGDADAVRQRSADHRIAPPDRAVGMLASAQQDATCAEFELMHGGGRTLVSLLDAMPGELTAVRNDLESSLQVEPREFADAYADQQFDPMRHFRAVRRAYYLAWQAAFEQGLNDPIARAFILRSYLAAVKRDSQGQWSDHGNQPVEIQDRWYREASNIEEQFAIVGGRR